MAIKDGFQTFPNHWRGITILSLGLTAFSPVKGYVAGHEFFFPLLGMLLSIFQGKVSKGFLLWALGHTVAYFLFWAGLISTVAVLFFAYRDSKN